MKIEREHQQELAKVKRAAERMTDDLKRLKLNEESAKYERCGMQGLHCDQHLSRLQRQAAAQTSSVQHLLMRLCYFSAVSQCGRLMIGEDVTDASSRAADLTSDKGAIDASKNKVMIDRGESPKS